jgi:hypothetical protein
MEKELQGPDLKLLKSAGKKPGLFPWFHSLLEGQEMEFYNTVTGSADIKIFGPTIGACPPAAESALLQPGERK